MPGYRAHGSSRSSDYAYPYGADGNGGPPLLAELTWGAHAADRGTMAAAEPLFPRLDVEPSAT